ncbi:MAG: DUF4340 domain-containing protein [Clostridia bacterium]|nr:DUF4340 domain-containing protein [Clostridia bacterium]
MSEQLRKNKSDGRKNRLLWLMVLAVLLIASVLVLVFMKRPVQDNDIPDAITYGELMQHDAAEVQSLTITRRGEAPWTIRRKNDGTLALAEDPAFNLEQGLAEQLLRAVAVISYDDILTEDKAEYIDQLEELGLAQPRLTLDIAYTDGQTVRLNIGMASPLEDETWSYMLVEGDDRLFAVDKGTVDMMSLDRETLHPVVQPVIHKSRMNRITFEYENGTQAAWQLMTDITDSDVDAAWYMTSPKRYPADAESISNLRSSIANLRVGAYVGQATDENLTKYGFARPRFVLTIHQAAGTVASSGTNGAASAVDYPESTVTITVGGSKSEYVDYVLVEDCIYTTGHFGIGALMDMDVTATLSRYPVTMALGKLKELHITAPDRDEHYILHRETVVGEDGTAQEQVTVTCNGQPFSWEAFEAAYLRLETVTVSGVLPQNASIGAVHTTYRFTASGGQTVAVSLAEFDAMHDAVVIDGSAVFYIIKNGMMFP